jgi:hypothetical protein
VAEQRLLLISRDDILGVSSGSRGDRLYRLLARLTRGDYQLLATAPQPEQWSREHGGPDDALLGPDSIRKRLSNAGGQIDGVYYVPRSLLTQKRNREDALRDMMKRYGVEPGDCYLFSSSRKFVEAAAGLGIRSTHLDDDHSLMNELKRLPL